MLKISRKSNKQIITKASAPDSLTTGLLTHILLLPGRYQFLLFCYIIFYQRISDMDTANFPCFLVAYSTEKIYNNLNLKFDKTAI